MLTWWGYCLRGDVDFKQPALDVRAIRIRPLHFIAGRIASLNMRTAIHLSNQPHILARARGLGWLSRLPYENLEIAVLAVLFVAGIETSCAKDAKFVRAYRI